MRSKFMALFTLLFLSSCLKGIEDPNDQFESNTVVCCDSTSNLTQDKVSETLTSSRESICQLSSGNFFRGECSKDGTLSEGYCKIGDNRLIYYKQGSSTLSNSQSNCPLNSSDGVSGVWVSY